MIKMGEITCRIPSNGIKSEILYCTEPEGYRLDIWAVGIEFTVAALTLLLFLVAYRTLKQMEADSAQQWESVKKQLGDQDRLAKDAVKADRELARDQHQTQLLLSHLQAVRTMQINVGDADAEMVQSYSDVSITWAAWSMFLDEDAEISALTQQYSDDIITVSQYIHGLIERVRSGELTHADIEKSVEGWSEIVAKYIANLLKWQSFPDHRSAKEENIRENLRFMRVGFDALFTDGFKVG